MKFFLILALSGLALSGCSKEKPAVRVYEVAKPKVLSSPNSTGDLKWDLPKGWVQVPGSSSMRLASFKVNDKVEVTLVALAGAAGGDMANVNRWRNQVGLEPMGQESITAIAARSLGKMGQFQWFKIFGKEKAILAASLKWGEQTLFVKMSGDIVGVKNRETEFLKYVKSVRTEGNR